MKSKAGHMNTHECSTDDGLKRTIKVYLAGTDKDKEGTWVTWYTKDKIQHLPWGPNRPYNDGDRYNCLMLESEMSNKKSPHLNIGSTVVKDEECGAPFCPVCLIDQE